MPPILVALATTTVALAVNETPTRSFADSWGQAHQIGIRATTLAVDWSAAETTPGRYVLTWPEAAEAFYPRQGWEVGLVLRDLNTVKDERPPDLRAQPYDAPESVARWQAFADAVLAAMPTTRFSWIAVGNEVDGVLQGEEIGQYGRFLHAAFAHLRKKRPGVRLGTCITFDALTKRARELKPLLRDADVAMVNYYLIDAEKRPARTQVPKDLAKMASFAGAKPLLLTECGAPSGNACGSSEKAQAVFYKTLLEESSRRHIPYLAFNWMNDIGTAGAEGFGAYYGSADPAFLDYLATLGIQDREGHPKPAWKILAKSLKHD